MHFWKRIKMNFGVLVRERSLAKGKVFKEPDFNTKIRIIEREQKRVKLMLESINTKEKTLVFCANIWHAGLIRDLINKL